jgi:hypothetical protein
MHYVGLIKLSIFMQVQGTGLMINGIAYVTIICSSPGASRKYFLDSYFNSVFMLQLFVH